MLIAAAFGEPIVLAHILNPRDTMKVPFAVAAAAMLIGAVQGIDVVEP